MEDMGIKYPLSLDIDRSGQLWVGCHKETGAKIHKINLLFIQLHLENKNISSV
jgi:hypothetical protein